MTIKDMSRSVCKGLTMRVSENSSNGNNCSDSNRQIIIFDICMATVLRKNINVDNQTA